MLCKGDEQVRVTLRQLLLNGIGQATCIGIELGIGCNVQRDIGGRASGGPGQHIHVEFRNHDLHT